MIQTMHIGYWLCLVYFVSYSTIAAQANNDITTDKSALIALKDRVFSDPHNMISSNWSTSTPVCNWVGVTCATRHHRVSELNLSYFGLKGTLPPELGNLSFLVSLLMRNNSFHNILPPELARLRRLKSFSLGYNKFKGLIPSWFGSLSNLQSFSLYGNQFSGSIPASIFNLSDLQVLDLRYNNLSGRISKEIGNLTDLTTIYLDGNNFEEIPNEIGSLNKLQSLYVQDNALKGHIPTNLFNITSLIYLSLALNKLSGTIPINICDRLPNIRLFYLSRNNFNGPLPSKLWQCKQLMELNLMENKFNGRIHKDIGNLIQLELINLSFNNLTGTIPYEIGYLPNLKLLLLGDNNLNGHIPSSIFNMSTLKSIYIANNKLSGSLTLPTNTSLGLPNLQEFIASNNLLSGSIPNTTFPLMKNLQLLDIGTNSFSGLIPNSLCLLENLEFLRLYDNDLTVDTSSPELNALSCLSNLRNLNRIDFDYNPFNTELPISFSNFSTSLHIIYFSNCGFRGKIPSHIGNFSGLIALYISDNQLSGKIPSSLGKLHNIQGLDLSYNPLEGNIPSELCQLQNLVDFGLTRSQLSGSIPHCLGSNLSSSLRNLYLGSNLLNSTIPSSLWGLRDLLALDLSNNSLSGNLSSDVGNLKVAIFLDVSHNQLFGNIPSSIGSLLSLESLSLADNNFEGSIPSSLGKCLSLVHLDLSHNNLTEVIPKSLEALSYLKYLNLSFNELQGEIPTGGPFGNLSAEMFVSNDKLCGISRFQVPQCKKRSSTNVLKYVIPGILGLMVIVAFMIWLLMARRRKRNMKVESILTPEVVLRRISYLELQSATNGFNESNLLGVGGFGSVYKGTLSDGTDVAVKVFNLDLTEAFTSFEVECDVLSNVRHRNLLKVISCCSQVDFKGIVLSYMPNGTLDKWLHSQNYYLNTMQRLDVMIDVAFALEYLHHGYEVPIVHCDLKPSNILLDEEMIAHVADFGVSKLLAGGDSMTQTMTLATIGYMAPEYGTQGIVTRRGDVYSFGIVMMEAFTRKKPTDEIFHGEMRLNQWIANSLVSDGNIADVVDATLLENEVDHEFMSKRECLCSIMRVAVACCAESAENRISIQEALATLEKIKIKFLRDSAARGVGLKGLAVFKPPP